MTNHSDGSGRVLTLVPTSPPEQKESGWEKGLLETYFNYKWDPLPEELRPESAERIRALRADLKNMLYACYRTYRNLGVSERRAAIALALLLPNGLKGEVTGYSGENRGLFLDRERLTKDRKVRAKVRQAQLQFFIACDMARQLEFSPGLVAAVAVLFYTDEAVPGRDIQIPWKFVDRLPPDQL